MKSVNLLIKPASSLCNLRCAYCFYADEASRRAQRSMGVMDEAMADALIRQAFEAVDADGMVSFAFQGGEPTLAGLGFFEHFAAMAAKHRPQGVRLHYAIQTNGTLLDERWAAFLKANRFLVGLSLDGLRAVHDAHRVNERGEGSWRAALAAKSLLDRHGVDVNALCVVTAPCAAQPERVYRSLKALGFRYMQFIACLDPLGCPRGGEPWSLTPQAYGDFLCRLFDLWYRDWEAGDYHSIRLFEDYVHVLLGDGGSTCATCGQCGAYLVIEADGSAYPCDFYALDEWKIGTLGRMSVAEMAASETAARFLRWGREKPAECARCPYRALCGGGCKRDWYAGDAGMHNFYCPSFQALLGHALPRMRQIAGAEARARR